MSYNSLFKIDLLLSTIAVRSRKFLLSYPFLCTTGAKWWYGGTSSNLQLMSLAPGDGVKICNFRKGSLEQSKILLRIWSARGENFPIAPRMEITSLPNFVAKYLPNDTRPTLISFGGGYKLSINSSISTMLFENNKLQRAWWCVCFWHSRCVNLYKPMAVQEFKSRLPHQSQGIAASFAEMLDRI